MPTSVSQLHARCRRATGRDKVQRDRRNRDEIRDCDRPNRAKPIGKERVFQRDVCVHRAAATKNDHFQISVSKHPRLHHSMRDNHAVQPIRRRMRLGHREASGDGKTNEFKAAAFQCLGMETRFQCLSAIGRVDRDPAILRRRCR